jgi:hypothetical protein
MSDQQGRDEAFSADMLLIEELVTDLGLSHWPDDADTILEVGDLENTIALAVRHGLFTFETTSRGKRSTAAVFSSARDARRYLIMDLAEDAYRFHTRMAPIAMKRLAPDIDLEDGPTGFRLSWPDGEATFYDRLEAVTFSWVIDAAPAAIVASYRHPNGEPLFDLGVPADVEKQDRPRGRLMDPPPIETPPADDEEVDQATIDAVLTELNWLRRTPSGADILLIGDEQVGRAIAYRQSQFVYESVVFPDYRKARCTFSTAAAARRFMIADLGHVLRLRTSLLKIRPNRLAPGCTLEKGPTGFDVVWPGGRASFPIGYAGHQDALNFSWVASAELADIAGSYRHPNGEPLFDLTRRPRS